MEQSFKTTNVGDFDKCFKELCAQNNKVVGVFSGEIDPATGKNWCPDCAAAEETIEKVVPKMCKEKGYGLFFCSVG